MKDRIHLFEARILCRVGVPVEERRMPQEIVVDLSLEKDLREAATSESLAVTVDYAAVLTVITAVAQSREWVLIESIAESMCAAVLQEFPVESVRILLRKPAALRARHVAAAAVEMERHR
jgi:dihydroneopterin aldolase